jgi:hypothetical protein
MEIENREKGEKGIACSFWVGSAPTHRRRPFPAPAKHAKIKKKKNMTSNYKEIT